MVYGKSCRLFSPAVAWAYPLFQGLRNDSQGIVDCGSLALVQRVTLPSAAVESASTPPRHQRSAWLSATVLYWSPGLTPNPTRPPPPGPGREPLVNCHHTPHRVGPRAGAGGRRQVYMVTAWRPAARAPSPRATAIRLPRPSARGASRKRSPPSRARLRAGWVARPCLPPSGAGCWWVWPSSLPNSLRC